MANYGTYIVVSLDRSTENDWYVKIGRSNYINTRVQDLKVCDKSIELFAYSSNDNESFLHKQYEGFRDKGEWFLVPDIIMKTFLMHHHDFYPNDKVSDEYKKDWYQIQVTNV